MDILGIGINKGPSLLATSSCVYAPLFIPEYEQEHMKMYEEKALLAAEQIIQKLNSDSSYKISQNADVPCIVFIASLLTEEILRKLDCYHQGPWIISDHTGEYFYIVIPEYDQYLERVVLEAALTVAVSAFPETMCPYLPEELYTKSPLLKCEELLAVGNARKKSSIIAGLIKSLIDSDYPWLPLDQQINMRNHIQIGYGRFQQMLDGSLTFESSHSGVRVSLSKVQSKQYLSDLGFPVTRQVIVTSPVQAAKVAEAMGFPVVVKTEYGAQGNGVICDLRNEGEVTKAFSFLMDEYLKNKRSNSSILVEKFVRGEDYRITMVRGKLLFVVHRMKAGVVGDGVHSIRELVEIENRSPLRGDKNSGKSTYAYLNLGEIEVNTLLNNGYTPDSIPDEGEDILLRANANWSSGGKVEYVNEDIHPDNVMLAQRIADALSIDIIGIDVITHDIGKSFMEGDLTVIEVNHTPGLISAYDSKGNFVDEVMDSVSLLCPDIEEGYVPIVVVLGDKYSTASTHFIGKLLKLAGYVPGVVSRSGMMVNGKPWAVPASINYRDPAFTVLRNKEIDVAVVQRHVRQIQSYGVGSGGCDIGIILSASPELIHTDLWSTGIKPEKVLALLMGSCRKACVALIDDPLVETIATKMPSSKLCVLSLQGWGSAVTKYVKNGAKAVVMLKEESDRYIVKVVDDYDGRLPESEYTPHSITIQGIPYRGRLQIATALGALLSMGYKAEESTKFLSVALNNKSE